MFKRRKKKASAVKYPKERGGREAQERAFDFRVRKDYDV